jgi:hypothetical protein
MLKKKKAAKAFYIINLNLGASSFYLLLLKRNSNLTNCNLLHIIPVLSYKEYFATFGCD